MPLTFVVVAAGLMMWTQRNRTNEADAIRVRIDQVCDALRNGRDLTGHVNPADAFTEQAMLAAIKNVLDSASPQRPLTIMPAQPSTTGAAGLADSATHTVTFRLADVDALHVRVKYEPGVADIRLTGFWRPAAAASP